MADKQPLSKTNYKVFKVFCKANDAQKLEMVRILRGELENLKTLLVLMERRIDDDFR